MSMSKEKSVSVQVGPGFIGTLTLIFITLKLLGKIDWSWWWVLSPLWIGAAFSVVLMIIALLIAVLVGVFGK